MLVFGGGNLETGTFHSSMAILDTHTWRWTIPTIQASSYTPITMLFIKPGAFQACPGTPRVAAPTNSLQACRLSLVLTPGQLIADISIVHCAPRTCVHAQGGGERPTARLGQSMALMHPSHGPLCLLMHGGRTWNGDLLEDAWLLELHA